MYTADRERNTILQSRFRLHHNVCQSASAVTKVARMTRDRIVALNALDYTNKPLSQRQLGVSRWMCARLMYQYVSLTHIHLEATNWHKLRHISDSFVSLILESTLCVALMKRIPFKICTFSLV